MARAVPRRARGGVVGFLTALQAGALIAPALAGDANVAASAVVPGVAHIHLTGHIPLPRDVVSDLYDAPDGQAAYSWAQPVDLPIDSPVNSPINSPINSQERPDIHFPAAAGLRVVGVGSLGNAYGTLQPVPDIRGQLTIRDQFTSRDQFIPENQTDGRNIPEFAVGRRGERQKDERRSDSVDQLPRQLAERAVIINQYISDQNFSRQARFGRKPGTSISLRAVPHALIGSPRSALVSPLAGSNLFSALGVSGWRRDLSLDPLIPAYMAGNGFANRLSYLPPINLNATLAGVDTRYGLYQGEQGLYGEEKRLSGVGERGTGRFGQSVRLGLSFVPALGDCTLALCADAQAAVAGSVLEGSIDQNFGGGENSAFGYRATERKARQAVFGAPILAGPELSSPVLHSPVSSWSDVFETSLYLENILNVDEAPLRFGVEASFVSADRTDQSQSAAVVQSEDYESITVGLNLDYRGLSFGGSVRNARGGIGISDLPEQDYLAFETGVALNLGNLSVALGYGEGTNLSSDYFGLYRDSQSAQAGVSFVFDRGVTIGAAAQFVQPREGQLELDPEASVTFESAFKF